MNETRTPPCFGHGPKSIGKQITHGCLDCDYKEACEFEHTRTPGAVIQVEGKLNVGDSFGSKPTNPKDAIGCNKVPMHLWPETATILGAMALLDGALKYGRANWREAGVRSSIYFDACRRHMNAWFEGEDLDPDSGLPHLGHALACVAILVDSQAKGNLVDDRMYPGGYRKLIDEMTPEVKRLREKYADRNPKHWTIKDAEKKP